MSSSSMNALLGTAGKAVTVISKQNTYYCYLLRSLSPSHPSAWYVGFTTNPLRRLRQHNGELTAGAKKTSNKSKRPWQLLATVYGFPSKVSALQFEWAWQWPQQSRVVRPHIENMKFPAGAAGRVFVLYHMLRLSPFQHYPLHVRFPLQEQHQLYYNKAIAHVAKHNSSSTTVAVAEAAASGQQQQQQQQQHISIGLIPSHIDTTHGGLLLLPLLMKAVRVKRVTVKQTKAQKVEEAAAAAAAATAMQNENDANNAAAAVAAADAIDLTAMNDDDDDYELISDSDDADTDNSGSDSSNSSSSSDDESESDELSDDDTTDDDGNHSSSSNNSSSSSTSCSNLHRSSSVVVGLKAAAATTSSTQLKRGASAAAIIPMQQADALRCDICGESDTVSNNSNNNSSNNNNNNNSNSSKNQLTRGLSIKPVASNSDGTGFTAALTSCYHCNSMTAHILCLNNYITLRAHTHEAATAAAAIPLPNALYRQQSWLDSVVNTTATTLLLPLLPRINAAAVAAAPCPCCRRPLHWSVCVERAFERTPLLRSQLEKLAQQRLTAASDGQLIKQIDEAVAAAAAAAAAKEKQPRKVTKKVAAAAAAAAVNSDDDLALPAQLQVKNVQGKAPSAAAAAAAAATDAAAASSQSATASVTASQIAAAALTPLKKPRKRVLPVNDGVTSAAAAAAVVSSSDDTSSNTDSPDFHTRVRRRQRALALAARTD